MTDDILKRAVEQRRSVVTNEFKDRQGVKISTFKRPSVSRKQSRTRFSTTTIWEMNVDRENQYSDNDDGDKNLVSDEESVVQTKKRRQGVDNSNEKSAGSGLMKLDLVSEMNSSDVVDIGLNSNENMEIAEKSDEVGVTKAVVTADVMRKYDDDEGTMNRRISANQNWDKVLLESNIINKDASNPTGNTTGNKKVPKTTSDEALAVDGDNEKWSKAQNIVKFVRPIYKPLNLDNVQCKVPKGKSDPKDCLSKDPVHVGWAKMVGKRIKTKQIKKKDGTAKTVSFREGRSLPGNIEIPKDVMSYTKLVSHQHPPHQRRQSIAIFNNIETMTK